MSLELEREKLRLLKDIINRITFLRDLCFKKNRDGTPWTEQQISKANEDWYDRYEAREAQYQKEHQRHA